jgi:transposase
VKLGEDVTETLEVIPRQWKVVQTVREKFACRSCEAITQPPAPFHPIMRGRAGPHLLATILEAKFGQHLPLNRLSETFAREGISFSTSTIEDWVGASTATLTPLMILIDAHALAAERLHGDDTTVPVLAAGRTDVGRFWTYVRDDAPFGGTDPPAAMFRYSRDRKAIHPERHLAKYSGILQADAYAGLNGLYAPGRQPGPILEAACWAHGRRKLFKLAEVHHMPLAIEAVRQIDAIFAAEAAINGKPAAERLGVRQRDIAPLVAALEAWMRAERAKLSRHNDLAQAMDYMLKRWEAFTRFLNDGRIDERGTCDNPRTILRDRLLGRVLAGIKERLLAPDLVDQFVATFVAEVNAANSQRGNRQALLIQQKAKVERQIRNMLELIKEGHGTPAMVAELRVTEHRLAELSVQIAAEHHPETVPVLHPNLPELYRRRVEALEVSLVDPSTCLAATEALRGLIDAIQIHPGERRGELAVSLRGDLAASLRSSDEDGVAATKVGLRRAVNGCSVDVMGSLDAGTGFGLCRTRLS